MRISAREWMMWPKTPMTSPTMSAATRACNSDCWEAMKDHGESEPYIWLKRGTPVPAARGSGARTGQRQFEMPETPQTPA